MFTFFTYYFHLQKFKTVQFFKFEKPINLLIKTDYFLKFKKSTNLFIKPVILLNFINLSVTQPKNSFFFLFLF